MNGTPIWVLKIKVDEGLSVYSRYMEIVDFYLRGWSGDKGQTGAEVQASAVVKAANLPGLGRCPGAHARFAMPEGCKVQAGQASRPVNIPASIDVRQWHIS